MLEDLFNLEASDFIAPVASKGSTEIYKPNPTKGKDGVYTATIRFVPNWQAPKTKSRIVKNYIWAEMAAGGREFGCATSTGAKNSPISDLFFLYWNKFKKSKNIKDEEMMKKFSRQSKTSSLVQIIDDKHQPDLNGKIMVYQFPAVIGKMIDKELTGDADAGEDPISAYDLFEGRQFLLKICKKGEWNNYDDSKFTRQSTPIVIDGKPLQRTKEGMAQISEYLKSNSPDLCKFDFVPWTDETQQEFDQFVKEVINPGAAGAAYEIASMDSVPDLDLDTPAPKASAKKSKAVVADADDDLYGDL